jgi:hypothetical protein
MTRLSQNQRFFPSFLVERSIDLMGGSGLRIGSCEMRFRCI